MKLSVPWNRFAKHASVFILLTLILLGFFVSRFFLIPVVLLTIPLVHRIERDYRSMRQKCPRCRRWKPSDEMDVTFCKACVKQVNEEDKRVIQFVRGHRHPAMVFPVVTPPRKPPEPEIRVSDDSFALHRPSR